MKNYSKHPIAGKPQTSPLATWLEGKSILATAKLVSMPVVDPKTKGADWKDTAFKYTVSLSHFGHEMTTTYYCGSGHSVEKHGTIFPIYPSLADVLHSLLLDSTACQMSFAEWCSEFGENEDSRKALSLYEQCQQVGDNLKRLFPRDMLEEMKGLEH